MVHDEEMIKIKEGLNKYVSIAEQSVEKIKDVIPSCNVYDLSYLIGSTDKAYGAATILHELFPNDSDIHRIWDKSYEINATAYKHRNTFAKKCECKHKEK